MRKIDWDQADADGVLEALVFYMRNFPTVSTRHRRLRRTFRNLGDALLSGEQFRIVVEQNQQRAKETLDDRFQRVCSAVRERRIDERYAKKRILQEGEQLDDG